MDKIKDKVSVIIPVYNSEKTIVQVLDSIKRQTRFDYICEILVINDGSKDNTLEVLEQNNFNYIDSICNLGLFGAVQTGFKLAMKEKYDVVIQFDGDGQHSAKYIDL